MIDNHDRLLQTNVLMTSITFAIRLGTINIQVSEFWHLAPVSHGGNQSYNTMPELRSSCAVSSWMHMILNY